MVYMYMYVDACTGIFTCTDVFNQAKTKEDSPFADEVLSAFFLLVVSTHGGGN